MTGSVVKVGQALADRLTGGGGAWFPPLLLWSGFVGGAVAGAIATSRLGLDAFWIGSAAALTLAVVGRTISVSLAEQN